MDLGKTQFMSLTAKAVTTALGIIQSVVVIRILGPEEFGLVGLVISIGSVVGVSQHLGVVEGTIREIAILKDKREIGKVFWSSHIVRQLMTIPLSAGLLMLAGWVAGSVYGKPEIAVYLQLFAGILVLQGLQDVLGSVLTGRRLFVPLYVIQVITAAINVLVFSWLTWQYRMAGFFAAMVVTTIIMIMMLGYSAWRDLRGSLKWPAMADIKLYGGRVLKIGVFMYLARIFFVVWQRLPIVLLGGVLPASELGFLNVSQTFGSKLTIVAMALSEVNMAWMSSLFLSERKMFAETVSQNMRKVLVVMVLMATVLLFFTPEIIRYIIGSEFMPAQNLILVMTIGFFLYALIDIGTSSVFVPANNAKLRTVVYGVMVLVTGVVIAALLLGTPAALPAAWAVTGGAAVSYALMVSLAKSKYGISLISGRMLILIGVLGVSLLWLLGDPALIWRVIIFVLLLGYIFEDARKQKLLSFVPGLGFRRKSKEFAIRDGDEASEAEVLIVCFAGAKYESKSWTNRQQVMSRLAKKYRVLYVEPRTWAVRVVIRNWNRPNEIIDFFSKVGRARRLDTGLLVRAQCNLLPGSREVAWISKLNHGLNRQLVMREVKRWRGRGKVAAWLYDTEAAQYLVDFKDDLVVYDCVDDHAAQAGVDRNPERVKEEEEEILGRADLVTVTSRALFERMSPKNANTHLVLNAGDVELFKKGGEGGKVKRLDLPKPILGMVGALDDYKIDFAMLKAVALRQKFWQFVLIGKPVVGSKQLQDFVKLDNVTWLGEITREEVPEYVSEFDLCLIPYRLNRYNKASFPLKFWEFMATGKPIVASGLPELKAYDELIGYAESEREFEELCEKWLKEGAAGKEERIELASRHGWSDRVRRLDELMCLALMKRNVK